MKREDILALYADAEKRGYALGSFSPRNTWLIPYVCQAAQNKRAPILVQISSNELRWFSLTAREFAQAFFQATRDISVPVILHLDHTYDPQVVFQAIEAGFQSVMIDGSKLPFEENIALTRQVVEYAHPRGVAVEAELGNIGGADKLETGGDALLYTVPQQVPDFVARSGCDSLAVSVGTAHGVYPVKNPKIDVARLQAIRALTDVPLVLHGGSGLPRETVEQTIRAGINKINIATDLELAFQAELGIGRMANAQLLTLDAAALDRGGKAVQALVENRIETYLFSCNMA